MSKIALSKFAGFLCLVLSVGLAVVPVTHAIAAPKNITIAFQGPLSGPEGVVGKDQLDAVKFAVYHFNQHFNGKF